MEATMACNSISPFEVDASLASSPCFSGRSSFSTRLPTIAVSNAGYLYLAIRSGQRGSYGGNSSAPRSLPPSSVHLSREKYVAPKFEETPGDDDETLVEKMRGLLKERRTDEAWQVMQILTRAGKLPDRQCASRLVAQLAHRGVPSSLARAQQVLSRLRTQDRLDLLDSDALGLLAMASARSGAARYALNVLQVMFEMGFYPSVKVWSAVVSRLGRHVDDCLLALELFDDVCLRVREAESQSLDVKSTRPDTGAFNAALNACATLGFAAKGEELMGTLEIFNLEPDDITFNTLIKLYAKTEQRELLKSVPDQMVENGVKPDQATLNSLVAAYVGLGDLVAAEALLRRLQDGDRESGSWWGAHLKPDVRTYTTMMKGYVQKGRRSDAMRTLLAMQMDKDPRSAPNEVTYTTAISSCVRLGLMDEASAVLQEMARQNIPANVVTYNVLLKGYCTTRRLQKAQAVVADMEKVGIALDVVSYNTMINGCIEADDNIGALDYFKKMREAGIAPSAVSYTTLMKAFGRNGQPKQVHLVFEEMRSDPSMKTDAIAWNVLLDSYCRNGRAADAKRMFLKMKEDRVQPTAYTYATLVKGYAEAGMAGEVLVLWREIKERTDDEVNPLQPDEVLLNCLVDTCVRAGFFQKALEVVACMEEKGIPANKTKYKRIFIELYSNLYTGKHASQRRRDRSEEKRDAVEAFKFWLGMPNKYYNGSDDWKAS
ncbi:hypothetical protein KC19_4G021500 [Ceratodon purpureus]|uniref:At1g68980-like TPR repeats domain-containing protein n=1 Tax=Ceratodon purpureus TaxID=3225 RepID=A0A8T0I7M1_CERPU|nr:hypothetical protein KC19_4G021500 [Ceratodon purpureus]